ncbi:MAG: CbtB-domain containing protein [Chloroflexi bacterium]|nr:CbtB-domain containing protein [Chloroflexota bacterium]
MEQALRPAREQGKAPLIALLLGLAMLYIVGLDQGQLLSVIQGDIALNQNLIHEAVHDARHAAGFPCH